MTRSGTTPGRSSAWAVRPPVAKFPSKKVRRAQPTPDHQPAASSEPAKMPPSSEVQRIEIRCICSMSCGIHPKKARLLADSERGRNNGAPPFRYPRMVWSASTGQSADGFRGPDRTGLILPAPHPVAPTNPPRMRGPDRKNVCLRCGVIVIEKQMPNKMYSSGSAIRA